MSALGRWSRKDKVWKVGVVFGYKGGLLGPRVGWKGSVRSE